MFFFHVIEGQLYYIGTVFLFLATIFILMSSCGMSSRFGTEKKGLGTLKRETTSWSQSPPNPNLSYGPTLMNTRHQGTGKGKEEQKEIYIKNVKYCPKIKTWLVRKKTLIILCLESPDFQWSNITLTVFFSVIQVSFSYHVHLVSYCKVFWDMDKI